MITCMCPPFADKARWPDAHEDHVGIAGVVVNAHTTLCHLAHGFMAMSPCPHTDAGMHARTPFLPSRIFIVSSPSLFFSCIFLCLPHVFVVWLRRRCGSGPKGAAYAGP